MVTFGNLKLPQNCMIFNMNPAIECPSAKLGLCKISNKCYAKLAERQYSKTLAFRYRQERFFKSVNSEELGGFFIGQIYTKETLKYPVDEIRFSEAGDFEDQHSIEKLARTFIAVRRVFPDITIYGYTARADLDFTSLQKVAVVNGSGFMLSNNFKAIPASEIDPSLPRCINDCSKCNLCKIAKNITIQAIIK